VLFLNTGIVFPESLPDLFVLMFRKQYLSMPMPLQIATPDSRHVPSIVPILAEYRFLSNHLLVDFGLTTTIV
jgi:hypothetical protein